MERESSIERTIGMVILAILAIGCLLVLRPFFTAVFFALILVVATWPAFDHLQHLLGGRRTLAALVMVALATLVFVVPPALVASSVDYNIAGAVRLLDDLAQHGMPPPPAWVAEVDVIGPDLHARWQEFAAGGPFVRALGRRDPRRRACVPGGAARMIAGIAATVSDVWEANPLIRRRFSGSFGFGRAPDAAEQRRLETIGAARPPGGGDDPGHQLGLEGALGRQLGAGRGVQSDQAAAFSSSSSRVRAHRPCLSALRALRALPAAVLGPRERAPLRRLASARALPVGSPVMGWNPLVEVGGGRRVQGPHDSR